MGISLDILSKAYLSIAIYPGVIIGSKSLKAAQLPFFVLETVSFINFYTPSLVLLVLK